MRHCHAQFSIKLIYILFVWLGSSNLKRYGGRGWNAAKESCQAFNKYYKRVSNRTMYSCLPRAKTRYTPTFQHCGWWNPPCTHIHTQTRTRSEKPQIDHDKTDPFHHVLRSRNARRHHICAERERANMNQRPELASHDAKSNTEGDCDWIR